MGYRDTPLPPKLAAKWGHLRHVRYKGRGTDGDEWSAECPVCGENGHVGNDPPDRFFMHDDGPSGNARGQCRRCGHFEWADENTDTTPDPARILEAQELRRKHEERERLRLKAKIQQLQQEAYYKGWHDSMTAEQRRLWVDAGIPESFQDHWELGYLANYNGFAGGDEFSSPALTIPYFAPGRTPYNIQYRLLAPPNGKDKYRFSRGLSTGLWLTDPDTPPEGACLLCEGVKKAAVAYIETVARLNQRLTVVSAPAKKPKLSTLDALAACDPIWIAFDPDAYEPIRTSDGVKPPAVAGVFRYLRDQGHDVRVIKFPMKLDDMLLTEGVDGNDVLTAMRRARVLVN